MRMLTIAATVLALSGAALAKDSASDKLAECNAQVAAQSELVKAAVKEAVAEAMAEYGAPEVYRVCKLRGGKEKCTRTYLRRQ